MAAQANRGEVHLPRFSYRTEGSCVNKRKVIIFSTSWLNLQRFLMWNRALAREANSIIPRHLARRLSHLSWWVWFIRSCIHGILHLPPHHRFSESASTPYGSLRMICFSQASYTFGMILVSPALPVLNTQRLGHSILTSPPTKHR